MTNISHVSDLSSMLTLAVEKPEAANGSIFNAVSERATTFDGLVRLCAKAAGKEAEIVHYNPKEVGVDAKKAFPFRNMVRNKLHNKLSFLLSSAGLQKLPTSSYMFIHSSS